MKHIVRTGLLAAALAVSGLAGNGAALAQTLNVTIVAGHPPVFRWVKHASQTFIPAVNKALEGTGTTIEWSEQYGGSLAKVGEELEAVEEGLAEIGLVSSLFDPAKLAPQNVTYFTPFVVSDSTLVSEWMDRLQMDNADMKAAWEANGLEYLGGAIGIDDYLLMTNFPVNSIADLEGRKIGAPGPAVNWLAGTGAVGVSGNLTTYYNEIKTGVYDGVLVFASAALPGKLYEVAPYVTRAGLGAQYAGSLCANADWYEGLPDDVKAALKTGADAARDWYTNELETAVGVSLEKMAEAGATVANAPDAMRAAWAKGMENAAAKWAAELDAQGKPATEVLTTYMEAMRAAGATPLRDWDKE